MKTLRLILALCAVLAACGGGSDDRDDDPRSGTGPVGCQQKPESCR